MQNTADIIEINRLKLDAFVGCYKEEQEKKQPLFATISLAVSTEKAARKDDLTLTIDYDALAQIVTEEIESRRFNLIEAVAERIADICLNIPRVDSVRIKVEKPTALNNAECAAITIFRRKK